MPYPALRCQHCFFGTCLPGAPYCKASSNVRLSAVLNTGCVPGSVCKVVPNNAGSITLSVVCPWGPGQIAVMLGAVGTMFVDAILLWFGCGHVGADLSGTSCSGPAGPAPTVNKVAPVAPGTAVCVDRPVM